MQSTASMPAGRPGAILGTATLMGILTGFQPIGRCMVLVVVPAGRDGDAGQHAALGVFQFTRNATG